MRYAFCFSRNNSLACTGIYRTLKLSYDYIVCICDCSCAIDCVTFLVIRGCDSKHRADVRPREASRGTCELVGLLLSITTNVPIINVLLYTGCFSVHFDVLVRL